MKSFCSSNLTTVIKFTIEKTKYINCNKTWIESENYFVEIKCEQNFKNLKQKVTESKKYKYVYFVCKQIITESHS